MCYALITKTIRKKGKNDEKKAAYLCTVMVLLMTAGCGSSDADSDVSTVDTINFNDEIDTGAEESNSNDQSIE